MTARRNSLSSYTVPAVSLGLAAVFFYASIDKLRDPLQFAANIGGFAILPAALISPFAMSLPPFEIACGFALLWPRFRRIGALAVAFISVVFFTALSSALLRGLTLDCGCFGVGAPSRSRMWLELGLDIALFGGATFVYRRSMPPRAAAKAI
jgi:putative oxidoreductase